MTNEPDRTNEPEAGIPIDSPLIIPFLLFVFGGIFAIQLIADCFYLPGWNVGIDLGMSALMTINTYIVMSVGVRRKKTGKIRLSLREILLAITAIAIFAAGVRYDDSHRTDFREQDLPTGGTAVRQTAE